MGEIYTQILVLQRGSPLAALFYHTDSSVLGSAPALYSLMYDFVYLLAGSLSRNQHGQSTL